MPTGEVIFWLPFDSHITDDDLQRERFYFPVAHVQSWNRIYCIDFTWIVIIITILSLRSGLWNVKNSWVCDEVGAASWVEGVGKGGERVFEGTPIERAEGGGEAASFSAAPSPDSSFLEKRFDYWVGHACL